MDTITELYEKVYLFENNKEILKYKLEYRNIPMWPLIRTYLLQHAVDKKSGIDTNAVKRSCIKKNKLMEFTIRNPFLLLPKDILYVGYDNSLMGIHEKGLIYDERIMPYVHMNENSCMLIANADFNVKYAYDSWKSDYAIHWLALKKANISSKDSRVAKELLEYIKIELPIEFDSVLSRGILNVIMGFSRYLPRYVKVLKQYLKIARPKLVILCCGSYMSLFTTAFNLACEDLHIPTAEIQHALEVKNSKAHHWGKAIVRSKSCKKMFPDYFLLLGKYWADAVVLPSKKIVIGTHRKYNVNMKKKNDNVLICLSANNRQYVELVKWVINKTEENTQIYLRLHPLENTKEERALFMGFKESGRFEFANEKSLEHYLGNCRYVISTGSTVVYEALTCGNVVFVPRDELYDYTNVSDIEDKIYSFHTLEELEKVWNKRKDIPMKAYDDFYNMNYKELYGRFLKKMIEKR